MTISHGENVGSTSRVAVSWVDGVVRLRDADLFGECNRDRCLQFLQHVFTLSEVAWVEVDRNLSTASIHYDIRCLGLADFLQRLATALRGLIPAQADVDTKYLKQDLKQATGRVKIQRFGKTLTSWDVIHDRPGRIRLRHHTVYRDAALANRLRVAIENLAGVIECAVWPATGSVLIRFDPDLTSAAHLLQILDHARSIAPLPEHTPVSPKPANFGLANVSLALAITGEMAAPLLLPASAVLLVGSNLHTFRSAGRQLVRGQFGLPVLYTSIVGVTLVSGQFVASAAMSWMLTFWSRRYHNDLAAVQRKLLGQIIHRPHYIRLAAPSTHAVDLEIPIEDLKNHDVIVVSAGEQIPADGRIVQGRALVDERMIRGVHGISRRQPDDEVFAGSTVQLGELQIEVLRHGSETRVARLTRIMLEATNAPHGSRSPSLRGEEFAEQTVAPTLAIAGLGLLIGDITTAGAILRPDYATGPGVAFPLETLQAVALSLRHGLLIRAPEAIERVATADMLIIEHHATLEYNELQVDTVEVFPGYSQDDVLRYAATAFHELDDERAVPLASACHTRMISLLDLESTEFATDLTLLHGNNRIKVGDLGSRALTDKNNPASAGNKPRPHWVSPSMPDSLMVGINGQVAGLIHFRRSDRLEAAATLRRLQAKRNLEIGIITEERSEQGRELSNASLGADFHVNCRSVDDRIRFLRNCRNRGFKVAYIGDREIDPRVMAEVHVAISLVGSETSNPDDFSAPICVLQPRMTKLTELWDIASIHKRRLRVAHGYALIPNLACIAGAFAWGFTSLASVVVTNLGTYCVYARTAASIRSLEHQIARSSRIGQASKRKTRATTKGQ